MTRTVRLVLITFVLLVGLAEPAFAAVTVSRAEVSGSRLRLEGTALPSRDITVDGVVLGRSDGSGAVRIERDPFTPPADCTVDVNDGSQAVTVTRLSGCTVTGTTPPPPGDTTAPTAPGNLTASVAGTTVNLGWAASTDVVGVAGYRVTRNGSVLPGTVTGTSFANSGLAAGTYSYTVIAFDGAGNTSTPSNSASGTVGAAEPLALITPSRLPDAVVGQAYLAYIVSSDPPGPSSFQFRLVAGRVPAGTSFVRNTLPARPEARVVGTPTAVGTSTFTVEVSDDTGATARRTYSVAVLAAPALAIAGGVNVLNPGVVGQPYGDVLSATGGVRPYTWAITAGTLPPGLSRVGDAFFGTPTTTGTYGFTARVTDSRGATTSGQFVITVGL